MANCGTCNHREVCRCFPNPEEYCCDFEPERPHGEWIPCSERLPEEDKAVLVYVRRKDIKKSAMNGFYIATKHHMEGDPEGNLNFWGIQVAPCEWRIRGWGYFFEPDVVAWRPLPEPYEKGETRECQTREKSN